MGRSLLLPLLPSTSLSCRNLLFWLTGYSILLPLLFFSPDVLWALSSRNSFQSIKLLIFIFAFQCCCNFATHCNLSLLLQWERWEEWMGTTPITQKSALGRHLCYLSASCFHQQQEPSSLHATFPSLATCSIFFCLPLLYFLSISFWSPRRLCPLTAPKIFCVQVATLFCYLSLVIFNCRPLKLALVACLPFRTLSTLLVCSPLSSQRMHAMFFPGGPAVPFPPSEHAFPTVGYTQMIYWASSVTCLWFPYTHWEPSVSLHEKHLAGS